MLVDTSSKVFKDITQALKKLQKEVTTLKSKVRRLENETDERNSPNLVVGDGPWPWTSPYK